LGRTILIQYKALNFLVLGSVSQLWKLLGGRSEQYYIYIIKKACK